MCSLFKKFISISSYYVLVLVIFILISKIIYLNAVMVKKSEIRNRKQDNSNITYQSHEIINNSLQTDFIYPEIFNATEIITIYNGYNYGRKNISPLTASKKSKTNPINLLNKDIYNPGFSKYEMEKLFGRGYAMERLISGETKATNPFDNKHLVYNQLNNGVKLIKSCYSSHNNITVPYINQFPLPKLLSKFTYPSSFNSHYPSTSILNKRHDNYQKSKAISSYFPPPSGSTHDLENNSNKEHNGFFYPEYSSSHLQDMQSIVFNGTDTKNQKIHHVNKHNTKYNELKNQESIFNFAHNDSQLPLKSVKEEGGSNNVTSFVNKPILSQKNLMLMHRHSDYMRNKLRNSNNKEQHDYKLDQINKNPFILNSMSIYNNNHGITLYPEIDSNYTIFQNNAHDYYLELTTKAPSEPRVKKYSYFYLGRKLWYIPLYFTVWFSFYILFLIFKSIARHKVDLPNHYNQDR